MNSIILLAKSLILAAALTACSSSSTPGADTPGADTNEGTQPADDPVAGHQEAAAPAATPAPAASGVSPEKRAAACQAIADWRSEIIELPPEFAPTLPAGREELRFAPGMFKPDSETYFTYAFVLSLAPGTALDVGAMKSLLDVYYRGLIGAVAKSRKIELPIDQIETRVEGDSGDMRATIAMYDAFVTGEALTLELRMTVEDTCVTVKAAPQSSGAPVWAMLENAATCLVCAAPK